MHAGEIAFWIAMMVVAFAGLLGMQMRYFAGVSLRIYLTQRLAAASRGEVQAVILAAAGGRGARALDEPGLAAEADALRRAHPGPLSLIRTGRLICLIVPFALAAGLVGWRFWPL
ncbi:MAG: hypothetical protein AAGH87_05220 [Pseudomonadota bacterium]